MPFVSAVVPSVDSVVITSGLAIVPVCRVSHVVPLEEIVSALRAAGYNGYYDVELIGEEFEASDYPSLVAHAKQAFARLVDLLLLQHVQRKVYRVTELGREVVRPPA